MYVLCAAHGTFFVNGKGFFWGSRIEYRDQYEQQCMAEESLLMIRLRKSCGTNRYKSKEMTGLDNWKFGWCSSFDSFS